MTLGTIPTPPHATGFVENISGTSDSILFNRGHHLVAVAAAGQLRIGFIVKIL
jgi:hypothetical protein